MIFHESLLFIIAILPSTYLNDSVFTIYFTFRMLNLIITIIKKKHFFKKGKKDTCRPILCYNCNIIIL